MEHTRDTIVDDGGGRTKWRPILLAALYRMSRQWVDLRHPLVAPPVFVVRRWAGLLLGAANEKPLHLAIQGFSFGAGEMNRTPDLLITNELLYRLSYTGLALDYSVEW